MIIYVCVLLFHKITPKQIMTKINVFWGYQISEKKSTESPHIGMYPMVSVMGKHQGRVRILNYNSPSEVWFSLLCCNTFLSVLLSELVICMKSAFTYIILLIYKIMEL